MCKKAKILLGILLLFLAAIIPLPFAQVEAGSVSTSDFQMKGDTLVKYTGTASAVSIPTSVRNIGKEAFAGHTELVKVELPGYLESIDYNAFADCSSLQKIVIPDNVETIGNGAFSGCSSLESISLGRKLKELGTGVFADCNKLSSVTLSTRNTALAYTGGVIYSKDKKAIYTAIPGYDFGTYTMPSTIETIATNAFWGCDQLEKVSIGNKVKDIPDYTFANCENLTKVIFPYSLKSISLKAFADCSSLGEIELPLSVRDIHATAFDNCPKLSILAEEGSRAAKFEEERVKAVSVKNPYDDILSEEEQAALDAENKEKAQNSTGSVSNQIQSIGRLLGQTRIVAGNAVVLMDRKGSNVLSGNIRPTEEDSPNTKLVNNSGGDGLLKYVLVNNEKIADQAFYNSSDLKTYEIPATIKEIGDFSFARSGLTSIVIPEGVESIGYGAFYHCDDLMEITIPSTVTEIEPSAFDQTGWIEKVKENRTSPFTIVGDGILLAYSSLESKVEIPDGVKQIAAGAFKGNSRISSIALPDSLTIIGEEAFAGCSNLKTVSGGNSLVEIRDRAFKGCPIGTIKIPASVQKIGLMAFDISLTGKTDETKVAVFLGKKLPSMSYEKTATRLAHTDYRESILKDVYVAVVDDSITAAEIDRSVLSYEMGGFRGFICSVQQAPSGENPGILQLKFCCMDKRNVTSGTVPEEVEIYGEIYKVSVPEEGFTYLSPATNPKTEPTIQVEVNSSTLSSGPAPAAVMEDMQESYLLKIEDNQEDGGKIAAAYRKAVSGGKIYSLQVYDLTLYETRTMIPVTKAGKGKLIVTMPKPKGIDARNLQIVCLDEDGQLDRIEARTVTVDGTVCVEFEANGSGTYGIYN
ncbi:MAG: leucine-rich repeat domain-containing protein [Lachnospiraceae bacterium]|nr:leucine-rich repeat domain-containing protein [Lachnospiraceae bacterium]